MAWFSDHGPGFCWQEALLAAHQLSFTIGNVLLWLVVLVEQVDLGRALDQGKYLE